MVVDAPLLHLDERLLDALERPRLPFPLPPPQKEGKNVAARELRRAAESAVAGIERPRELRLPGPEPLEARDARAARPDVGLDRGPPRGRPGAQRLIAPSP